jgi:homogentisate phytyltransferase/homogentisate geranylgeranyltransferase
MRKPCPAAANASLCLVIGMALVLTGFGPETTSAFSVQSTWKAAVARSATLSRYPRQPVNPLEIEASSVLRRSPRSHTQVSVATSPFAINGAAPSKPPFWDVIWRFTRPHTLIGSALAIPAIHGLAATSLQSYLSRANLLAMLYAMFPSLLMNLYITGLNQITDVEIDKVNKPYLPLAAGELSSPTAIIVVIAALITSLWMGQAHSVLGSQGLNVALWGSAILGTLYSLPPVRLKRFPLLAAFCIVAVRGVVINASFFAHAQSAAFGALGGSVLNCLRTEMKCLLSCLFFGVFGVVIALMKDVPDVEGDALAQVRTFSVRAGQERIFGWMAKLLAGWLGVYGVGFLVASVKAVQVQHPVLAMTRLIVSGLALASAQSVTSQAKGVNPTEPNQVYGYYMHLWKIFYLCYAALPLAR